MRSPVDICQILTLREGAPVAKYFPSGENCIELNTSWRLLYCSWLMSFPDDKFHILADFLLSAVKA